MTAQVEATNTLVPVQIRLTPDQKTIMLGEPLFISFEVTNVSGEKLCLGVNNDFINVLGRPQRFKVSVRTAEGRYLRKIDVPGDGGAVDCDPIEPGETYSVRLFLPHWVTIERAGSYETYVTRQMSFFRYPFSKFQRPRYSMLAEAKTDFTVVPADENKMGSVINALGSVMLDAGDPEAIDSAMALASIDDKRVISYFAEALGRFGNVGFAMGRDGEYTISSRSITALATYDDDQAIAALQAAMKSTSDDVRLLVAKALGASPHRSASTLLMKMQDDSYYFVRLRVAQGLKNVETTEAKATLQKLLKDESNDVREAARESLN
ncbi:MAG TPA: HEAT repeat domain-containing protein [Pyrinomonadaceae bacterium]|nr:HEAT repeat domain-containing protein [Pyrinomonadaceae bacterium]